jgi:hypothetical protein
MEADFVRETIATRGWGLVLAEIDAHRERLITRLTHQSAKPDDIPYMRGQIEALGSMREAAESILKLAEEREAAANQESHV